MIFCSSLRSVPCARRALSECVSGLCEEPRLEPTARNHARANREIVKIPAHVQVLQSDAAAEDEMIEQDLLNAEIDGKAEVREGLVSALQVRVEYAADE